MRYIKQFETFKELYKINPDKDVVIRDEYVDSIDFITKSFWSTKDLPDKAERIKKFTGRIGKMKYCKDDFFAIIDYGDDRFQLPSYTLINKDQYDYEKAIKSYNL